MAFMKEIVSFFLLFYCFISISAQGELDEQDRIFYRNEKSGSVMLNSNGFGANFRYGKRIDARNKILYDIDLVSIKHPKEIKVSNPYYNNRSFVYGKLNNFFTLRPGIGRQHEMYRKVDKGGIAIRYFYNGGVSIGLYKPIYYEVFHVTGPDARQYYIEVEKFSAAIHQGDIYGRSGFFKGFNEIKFAPGVFVKAGLNFEYSTVDEIIHALEVGVVGDAFIRSIPLMANQKNSPFFFSLFVSYRFGKILNPIDPNSQKGIDNIFLK